MTPLRIIAGILALPTFTMILGGILAFRVTVHPHLIAALQHFASGILIGAVGSEIVPTAEAATGMGMLALALGFIVGFSVLLFVGRYDFSHWKKCYKMDEEVPFINIPQSTSAIAPTSSIMNVSLTDVKNFRGTQDAAANNDNGNDTDAIVTLHEAGTKSDMSDASPVKGNLSRENTGLVKGDLSRENTGLNGAEKLDDGRLPIGLMFAVMVDASIDGLLIGVNALTGVSAGLVTGIGLAIEMGLLGVSTSNTLRKTRLPLQTIILLILLLPCIIIIAGLIGATVLRQVTGNAEIAVTAFGCAGLLYLVTEAHEDEESNRWFVTVMFFIGFLFVVFLDKLMAEHVTL